MVTMKRPCGLQMVRSGLSALGFGRLCSLLSVVDCGWHCFSFLIARYAYRERYARLFARSSCTAICSLGHEHRFAVPMPYLEIVPNVIPPLEGYFACSLLGRPCIPQRSRGSTSLSMD